MGQEELYLSRRFGGCSIGYLGEEGFLQDVIPTFALMADMVVER